MPSDRRQKLIYGACALLILFLVRLPTFIYPIFDEDEGMHAVMGALIASGDTPYLDGVDGKFPLLWYQYAAIFKVFGLYNMIAVHAYTMLVVGVTAFLLYRIGQKLWTAPAGYVAALAYILFSTVSSYKVLASNFELHFLIWEWLAVYMVLRKNPPYPPFPKGELLNSPPLEKGEGGFDPARATSKFHWAIAGAAIGLSFLTKQQGGMILVSLPLAYWIVHGHWRRPPIKEGIALLFGFGSLIAAFMLIAARQGYLHDMLYWTLVYPKTYIRDGQALIADPWRAISHIAGWMGTTFPLWIAAGWTVKRRYRDASVKFLLVLLGAAWIPVSLGGRFYMHYFLMLLPALSLLASPAITAIYAQSTHWIFKHRRLVALICLLPVIVCFGVNMAMPLVGKAWGVVRPNYEAIGTRIAAMTSPHDRIFVWGWAPQFYVYSKRLPASRFIISDVLSGRVAGSDDEPEVVMSYASRVSAPAWQQLKSDFKRHPPTLIIDAAAPDIHDYKPYPIAQYPQLREYISQNYQQTMEQNIPIYIRNKD